MIPETSLTMVLRVCEEEDLECTVTVRNKSPGPLSATSEWDQLTIFAVYKCGKQTLPSDFRAIFEALRLFTTIQIMFYLFPLGLRILKWG